MRNAFSELCHSLRKMYFLFSVCVDNFTFRSWRLDIGNWKVKIQIQIHNLYNRTHITLAFYFVYATIATWVSQSLWDFKKIAKCLPSGGHLVFYAALVIHYFLEGPIAEGGGTHIDFHFGARTRLPQWVFQNRCWKLDVGNKMHRSKNFLNFFLISNF